MNDLEIRRTDQNENVRTLLAGLEKLITAEKWEEAETISRQIVSLFVHENIRTLENSSEQLENIWRQVARFRLFGTMDDFKKFLTKKNGHQTASTEIQLAFLATSSRGFATTIYDADRSDGDTEFPVVFINRNSLSTLISDMSAIGPIRSQGEILIEELKHAADKICGMIDTQKLNRTKNKVTMLLATGNLLTVWGYLEIQLNQGITQSPEQAWSLFLSGLLTAIGAMVVHSRQDHEVRARKLAKEIAAVTFKEKLRRLFSPEL